ncbi:MAG: peptidase prolyl oligopeptidase active site protein [Mucilaginibacter sp.]|nr:peptidase prolyl oligopeptidase active site protein [Mucilaginibacter sp.]
MKKLTCLYSITTLVLLLGSLRLSAQSFTMAQVTNYPFPRELTSCVNGSEIAFTIEDQGRRNIYVASGPAFAIRKLTNYTMDDGQEITSVTISNDGKWVVYVRGGEHSGNRDRSVIVNPANLPTAPKIEIWSIPFAGGVSKLLGPGDYSVVSPKSDRVAWINNDQVWTAPINGAIPGKPMFDVKGECTSLQFSPDGSKLAFECNRTDHSFIGVYTNNSTPINWISPSFSRDASPQWSPDGKKIAFIRTPGIDIQAANAGGFGAAAAGAAAGGGGRGGRNRGEAQTATPGAAGAAPRGGGGGGRGAQTWAIWTADIASGKGEQLWKAPATPRGSFPGIDGGANLHWALKDRIVFMSYMDGWPHIYSISPAGGEPLSLTPGEFEDEQMTLSHDGKWAIFSVNSGPDQQLDIDRRHIARVPVDKAAMEMVTTGTELETYPVITGDGQSVVMLSANAQRPLIVAEMPFSTHKIKLISEKLLATDFPVKKLSIPTQVIYKSPDGTVVHAQLYKPNDGVAKHPAILYIHGGPQRQMILGWHHMDYYSIDYALNQYLVSLGFEVLAINYRNGIGYGYDFNRPSAQGANYIDCKAGGEWLAAQLDVDTARLGVYGGSAGGALTATALARDSKLFKAGVIIHGNSQEPLDNWTSPTMIIHGDDDRNVAFSSGVSLIRRFELKGNPYFEFLVIPGDSHHWVKYSDIVKVNSAAADFLKKELLMKKVMASN